MQHTDHMFASGTQTDFYTPENCEWQKWIGGSKSERESSEIGSDAGEEAKMKMLRPSVG